MTLETASDTESIVVTLHRRHGMWLVWLGAALVAVATLGSARRTDAGLGRPVVAVAGS